MPQLRIVKRSGEEAIIDATAGHSVMEAITNSGVEDIAAICGACRSRLGIRARIAGLFR